jgi:N-methylhydantoinase B
MTAPRPQRIPGSEAFTTRSADPDAVLDALPPTLALHQVSDDDVARLDPLTYEVVRHRLWSITDEMADAIKRMSGSIVVTDANDFDFAISDELGQSVQIALYNTELAACIDLAIFWTLRNRAENPGIADGDMFLSNDPWVGGGLHQNDVSLIQPIFWEGELFAWTSAICHELDLGGVSPGSRSPKADSVFWEALPTPPLKIVSEGRILRDVEEAYVRRARTPPLVSLDLRAKLGANLLGRRRILALIERYGPTTVKAVMKRMMDDAEQRLRRKLRTLPDGSWHATQYIDSSGDGDRGVYAIELELTKRDAQLRFDFTGTSPQKGMINCTWAGTRGGVISAILPLLAGDIPWSPGGLLRCVDIETTPGALNDADYPAAIAMAPVGAAMSAGMAAVQCISKMLDTDPDLRAHAMAVCGAASDVALFSGTLPGGRPFLTAIAEHAAMGIGAKTYADGVDTGGILAIPQGRIPDAEMNEFKSPFLYVWRREAIDSGGPGRFRGGLSGTVCVVAHGVEDPMHCVASGAGKAVAQNVGLAGGYPGNTQHDVIVRGSRVPELLASGRIPGSLEELGGTVELVPAQRELPFAPGDAFVMNWQAGGGYMDPLLREPELVAHDVAEGKVSRQAGADLYGVVLDEGGKVDLMATARRRAQVRAERAARAGLADAGDGRNGAPPAEGAQRLSENFVVGHDGAVACTHCGEAVAAQGEGLYESLARIDGDAALAGPQVGADPREYTDEPVVFRQYICPHCHVASLTQLVPAARREREDTVELPAREVTA